VKEKKVYETKRLILKPTDLDDAEFVLSLLNSPKWIENIGDRNVHNKTAAENYIKTKMITQFEKLGYGNNTVIRKSDGAKMGSCGLYDREGLDGVDIGFAFLPEYEGMGYATEAALKVKTLAFSIWNIDKLLAITTKNNLSSQKLLEKLGMRLNGTTTIPGDKEELLLYELDQSDQ